MPLKSAQYKGITFRSSGQLWSNPSLRYTREGIPPMLVRPSFLDLVNLAEIFSTTELLEVNQSLFNEGLIDEIRYATTESMLQSIAVAQMSRENR